MSLPSILVLDDDRAVVNYLNILLLQSGGFAVSTLCDSTKAFDEISGGAHDILLLDMDMPEVTGLELLKRIEREGINIETIVLTGVEDVELAVSAMKLGAFDYLTKPINEEHLLETIAAALERRRMLHGAGAEPPASGEAPENPEAFREILTQDGRLVRLFRTAEKVAPTDNSVLIWGESGTGKELFARAIHRLSRRAEARFVAVNAGTFADELFASEFFGHSRGAFTGAVDAKRGLLEEADNGTLFLDEIGELALPIQVKLLRVLQEGEFFRLGSTKNLRVNVRIIAATNKNLFEETKKGNFRKDLFYRLNMNSLYIPPLRERKEDIPLLLRHFLAQFGAANGKRIERVAEPVLALLARYDYPGNVRELMNILNSAVIVESGPELRKKSLPQYLLDSAELPEEEAKSIPERTLQEVEREHIARVLQFTGGNRTRAAKILAISRTSLLAKIRQYGLS